MRGHLVLFCKVFLAFSLLITSDVFAQSNDQASKAESAPNRSVSPEFDQQAVRLRTLVYRRPQAVGTFDRWYQLYVRAGARDQLLADVQEYQRLHPEEAAAHLVAALVYERQRDWNAAAVAWQSAIERDPNDYFPRARLAEVQLRRQEFAEADKTLEAVLKLNLPDAEFQRLARQRVAVLQRSGQIDAAVQTLSDLSRRSSNDPNVYREVAQRLQQLGRPKAARDLWQQLATNPKASAELRFESQVQSARLASEAGEFDLALMQLQTLLAQVDPRGTRAEQLRPLINQVIDHQKGIEGRVVFWRDYIQDHPSDLSARIEWAESLARNNQTDAALDAYRDTVKRAPKDVGLRERMIGLLVQRGAFDLAVSEMEQLVQESNGNSQLLLELGKLQLYRAGVDDEVAQKNAVETWQKAVGLYKKNADVALAVADLSHESALGTPVANWDNRPREAYPSELRQRRQRLWNTAEAMYRESLRREPSADRRAQLANFLHRLGRGEEAVAVWMQSTDPSGSAWSAISKQLSRAGYQAAALQAAEKAVIADSQQSRHWTRWIEICLANGQYDDAYQVVRRMQSVRPQDQAWQLEGIEWRVRIAVASQQATSRLAELTQRVTKTPGDRNLIWEVLSLRKSMGQLNSSDPLLIAWIAQPPTTTVERARFAEMLRFVGKLDEASAVYRDLAAQRIPQRKAIYRDLIDLELQRGHLEAARDAADKMVRDLPQDPDAQLLLATVCDRQADNEMLVQALRRAIAITPRDVAMRRQFATGLLKEGLQQDALEQAMEAVRISTSIEQKESLLSWLHSWDLTAPERDWVKDQLQQQIWKEEAKTQEHSQALAFWLEQTGQPREALQQLTTLQSRRPLDSQLLRRIVELARQTDRLQEAVDYQKQLVKMDASAANMEILAQLFRQSGNVSAASEIWDRLVEYRGTEADATRLVDELLARPDLFGAQRLVEAALAQHPTSWQLGFRAALVHVALEQQAAARHELLNIIRYEAHRNDESSVESEATPFTASQALGMLEWVATVDARLRVARWKRTQSGRERSSDSLRVFTAEIREAASDTGPARARIASALVGLRLLSNRINRETLVELAGQSPENYELHQSVALALWIDGDVARLEPILSEMEQQRSDDVLPHLLRVLRFGRPIDMAKMGLASSERSLAWLTQNQPQLANHLRRIHAKRVAMSSPYPDRDEILKAGLAKSPTIASMSDWIAVHRFVAQQPPDGWHEVALSAARQWQTKLEMVTAENMDGCRQVLELVLDRPQPDDSLWQDLVTSWLTNFLQAEQLSRPAASAASSRRQSLGDKGADPLTQQLERLTRRLREMVALEETQREGRALGLAEMGGSSPFLDLDSATDLRRLLAPADRDWSLIEASRVLRASTSSTASERFRVTDFPSPSDVWSQQGLSLLQRVAAAMQSGTDSSRQRYLQQWSSKAEAYSALRVPVKVGEVYLQWWWNQQDEAVDHLETLVKDNPLSNGLRMALVKAYLKMDRLDAAHAVLSEWLTKHSAGEEEIGLQQAVWQRMSEQMHWHDLVGHAGGVTALTARPDGKQLASVGVDGKVRIWNVADGSLAYALDGHDDMIMAVAYSPDGKQLVSAGYDELIRRWDPTRGVSLSPLGGHSAVVRALAYSGDGNYLASAGDDSQIILWDAVTGEVRSRSTALRSAIQSLAFSGTGDLLISVSIDGNVRAWATSDLREVASWSSSFDRARACVFVASDSLAIGGEAGRMEFWQKQAGSDVWKPSYELAQKASIRGLAYNAYSGTLAVGAEDQLVHLWDLQRRSEKFVLKGHTGRVLAVTMPENGSWLASAGFDGTIKVWKLAGAPDDARP